MTLILHGKPVADAINEQTLLAVQMLKSKGLEPTLAIVRVGEDPASVWYERFAKKLLEKLEIKVETYSYPGQIAQEDFLKEFERLVASPAIHGFLLMQPLPDQIDRRTVASYLDPKKDIDGLTAHNFGELAQGYEDSLVPGTALAMMEILDFYDISLEGKKVCVVGRSPVVGRPAALMALQRHASVTILHSRSGDLGQYTKEADVILAATGSVHLITADMVKEGAIILDAGYGETADGETAGDVDYDAVVDKAAAITPVPGGVGSVTNALLGKQLIKAIGLQTQE